MAGAVCADWATGPSAGRTTAARDGSAGGGAELQEASRAAVPASTAGVSERRVGRYFMSATPREARRRRAGSIYNGSASRNDDLGYETHRVLASRITVKNARHRRSHETPRIRG